ncbi:MerR family transcriptional regulator [Streptomyces sp. G44]|uniref:MerR family transcriptional regulator n=1 Tax=Streptomyces sp. G44 TaxID=2807632 RepID=UPI001960CD23|nr:MerR family transcriptional regulator [Streptomyces sp. G44]MBM7169333.1 MerR family transcriptional regulator [Streptomyces sp. G44]
MLSIGDFSDMCHLPPQTLRYYHSEGLLVPADVDERSGYRSYTFTQVEQAMLITVLRGTGMSVKLVRRALDAPEAALTLLRQHTREVQRQRQAQDEAIDEAREFFTSPPEVSLRRVDRMTVVSKPVPNPSAGGERSDWDTADAAVATTIQDVVETVESSGAVVAGRPWRTLAVETAEQRSRTLAGGGPHWLVQLPVTADEGALASLPHDVEVRSFAARDELSIFIPGKSSMAKYATALSRLFTHPLDAAYVDASRMRQILHDDGVETAAAISGLDEPSAPE